MTQLYGPICGLRWIEYGRSDRSGWCSTPTFPNVCDYRITQYDVA